MSTTRVSPGFIQEIMTEIWDVTVGIEWVCRGVSSAVGGDEGEIDRL